MAPHILHLPFAYDVTGVVGRRRKPEAWTIRGFAPVEVDEVGRDEAPLAVGIVRHDAYGRLSEGERKALFPDGPPRNDYRWHGGRLFRPVAPLGEGISRERFQADVARRPGDWFRGRERKEDAPGWGSDWYPELPGMALRKVAEWDASRPRTLLQMPRMEDFLGGAREAGLEVRLTGSDIDSRREEAQAILSRSLLVIGGEVWTTTYAWEPHWQVLMFEPTARGVPGPAKVILRIGGRLDPASDMATFRIDHGDKALRHAEELAARHRCAVEGGEEEVVAVRPDLLRLDDAVMLARQVLAAVYELNDGGAGWPGEARDHMGRLLDLRRRGEDLTVPEAAEAFDRARRVLEGLAGTSASPPGAARFVAAAAEPMARWHGVERPGRPEMQALIDALAPEVDEDALKGLGF